MTTRQYTIGTTSPCGIKESAFDTWLSSREMFALVLFMSIPSGRSRPDNSGSWKQSYPVGLGRTALQGGGGTESILVTGKRRCVNVEHAVRTDWVLCVAVSCSICQAVYFVGLRAVRDCLYEC